MKTIFAYFEMSHLLDVILEVIDILPPISHLGDGSSPRCDIGGNRYIVAPTPDSIIRKRE